MTVTVTTELRGECDASPPKISGESEPFERDCGRLAGYEGSKMELLDVGTGRPDRDEYFVITECHSVPRQRRGSSSNHARSASGEISARKPNDVAT
jgi:hypothetical protein